MISKVHTDQLRVWLENVKTSFSTSKTLSPPSPLIFTKQEMRLLELVSSYRATSDNLLPALLKLIRESVPAYKSASLRYSDELYDHFIMPIEVLVAICLLCDTHGQITMFVTAAHLLQVDSLASLDILLQNGPLTTEQWNYLWDAQKTDQGNLLDMVSVVNSLANELNSEGANA